MTQSRVDVDATGRSVGAAETAASAGTIAALVGAVPLVGPALVAGCLSCVGLGTAAGLGATRALPPAWWLAGLAVTGAASTGIEVVRSRRCHRQAQLGTTLLSLAVVAVVAWVATRYGIVPLIDWLSSPDPQPVDGPILP